MIRLILSEAKIDDWSHAFMFMAFYVFGSLAPVLLSSVLLVLFTKPFGIGTFLDNGEFAIYTATALAPIFYLLFKRDSGLDKLLYFLPMLGALLVATAVFSGLTIVDSFEIKELQINTTFLRASSITIYALALLATFLVRLHENVEGVVNVEQGRKDREDELNEQFDATYDGK